MEPTGNEPAISVLLVDDHPMLRKGVRDLLELDASFGPIREARSGEEALELADLDETDIILMDLNMKGLSGCDTIRALRARDIDARILVFTVSDDHQDVIQAIKAGADGYVLKDTEPEEFIGFLKRTLEGNTVVSAGLSEVITQALKEGRPANQVSALDVLTAREREILAHIARGLSNKLIAQALNIAEGTVKVHVKNLLKKLNMRSRLEAAIWVMDNNFFDREDL